MDHVWIRWRQDFGDGLLFLSHAVSGEVSSEAFVGRVLEPETGSSEDAQ
jgi:hypothetical protein